MNILIFLIILLILVLVHEFGHFFTAKKFGIRVDEFGFGFPPKLFGVKRGETEYTFNLLPLGGFVKIFGENPNEENTNGPDASRSFINKPKWKQAIVLFAGVFMNFVLAWVLFSIGFMSGFPTSVGSESNNYPVYDVNTTIVSVVPKSPAEASGLKSGDKIIKISAPASSVAGDFVQNPTPEELKNFIVSHVSAVGQTYPLEINYIRGKDELSTVVSVKHGLNEKPSIGIAMDQIGTSKLPFFRAIKEGMNMTLYITKGTAVGLFSLISDGIRGKGSFASVTGPVGMVGIVGDAYQFGFVYLLSFAALISINLAIINLIPFPALDGGRLLFLLIEKIKGSRINPKIVNIANAVGFGILILLMLVVTFHDIVKLF